MCVSDRTRLHFSITYLSLRSEPAGSETKQVMCEMGGHVSQAEPDPRLLLNLYISELRRLGLWGPRLFISWGVGDCLNGSDCITSRRWTSVGCPSAALPAAAHDIVPEPSLKLPIPIPTKKEKKTIKTFFRTLEGRDTETAPSYFNGVKRSARSRLWPQDSPQTSVEGLCGAGEGWRTVCD